LVVWWCGAAPPGQILAAGDVRNELPEWPAIPQDPLILKGFDDPVMAYDLHLSRQS
jgi:adenylate cyclase